MQDIPKFICFFILEVTNSYGWLLMNGARKMGEPVLWFNFWSEVKNGPGWQHQFLLNLICWLRSQFPEFPQCSSSWRREFIRRSPYHLRWKEQSITPSHGWQLFLTSLLVSILLTGRKWFVSLNCLLYSTAVQHQKVEWVLCSRKSPNWWSISPSSGIYEYLGFLVVWILSW